MQSLKKIENPFLLFLPFLVLYIILAIVFPTDGMAGDETRYLLYAKYLYDGSLPVTDLNFNILGNGPGYSIILIPFVALHLPLLSITILNAFLYYFSIILLFNVLRNFISFRAAILISLFWACYINSYENIILILPETLTAFLVNLFCFTICKIYYEKNSARLKFRILFTGFILGYLALTKPIFGYVLLFMFIGNVVLWMIKRKAGNYKRGIAITVLALLTALPYLIHTYKLTHKVFYWSSLGGNNLYWMSTPYEGEYGDWFADPKPLNDTTDDIHYSKSELTNSLLKTHHFGDFNYYLALNHSNDFKNINQHSGIALDKDFTDMAIQNIKAHPGKYLLNCVSNASRMIFNYPYSYKLQSPATLIRLPFNGLIVVLALFCIIPTLINWKKIFYPIRYLLFFAVIYFGGSILASAETRMFTVIVPILLLWIGYIITHTVKFKLKF